MATHPALAGAIAAQESETSPVPSREEFRSAILQIAEVILQTEKSATLGFENSACLFESIWFIRKSMGITTGLPKFHGLVTTPQQAIVFLINATIAIGQAGGLTYEQCYNLRPAISTVQSYMSSIESKARARSGGASSGAGRLPAATPPVPPTRTHAKHPTKKRSSRK